MTDILHNIFMDLDFKKLLWTEKSNVGIFCDDFPPVMDGVAICAQNYAYWLQKMVGSVTVVTPRVENADYGSLPYKVMDYFSVPIPMRKPYVVGIPEVDPTVLANIVKTEFRIIHSHSPFTAGLTAQRVAAIEGIPFIATFHSKYRDDFQRIFPKLAVDAIIKLIVSYYESADMVWVPQESVKDVIREYGYKGPVEAMDNGSDLVGDYKREYFLSKREELGLREDDFVLLFVGQHIWEKNPRLVIEGLSRIPEIPFKMFFVGGGYAQNEMKALVKERGLEDKVTFTGVIKDREKITSYYAAADLFLFPSYYDNAPLVVREAAALHTPSVMVKGATASTIINDGRNGYLTENDPDSFADLIRYLSAHRDEVLSAGEDASRSIVRSWENVVEEVLLRYNAILKSKGKEPIERIDL